ncbi:hypothetical protein DCCM_0990 [Desulfocucumis palustris]|uniref:Uncharacterized protein n=1 Tax=Desulfocucumis palustris TaxID=1898651 RepID=A0A2L2XA16_9FIRM|nr:hypothetical protein DCCM_0990 [Desulfocucumis palustris]
MLTERTAKLIRHGQTIREYTEPADILIMGCLIKSQSLRPQFHCGLK